MNVGARADSEFARESGRSSIHGAVDELDAPLSRAMTASSDAIMRHHHAPSASS